MPKMNVQEMPSGDIKPYERNPRKNAAAVDYVANSIKEFGFKQPIVVDADHVIVVGHTRWLAAKKLKMKTVLIFQIWTRLKGIYSIIAISNTSKLMTLYYADKLKDY